MAPMPTSAALTNQRDDRLPSKSVNVARPTSIWRRFPRASSAAALSMSRGISSVRTKSLPVPRGSTPSAVPPAPFARSPSATSPIVPSPPTATTTSYRPAAFAAKRAASPGPAVRIARNGGSTSFSRLRNFRQCRPVDLFAERGLTISRRRGVMGRTVPSRSDRPETPSSARQPCDTPPPARRLRAHSTRASDRVQPQFARRLRSSLRS